MWVEAGGSPRIAEDHRGCRGTPRCGSRARRQGPIDRDRGDRDRLPCGGSRPLGHGFLTGQIRSPEQLADDDWRKTNPRFTGENFQRNLHIVDEVAAVASEADATPAQVALAWLLAQGDDVAPIPGTKRVSRVDENTAADQLELSAEQIERLNDLTPAIGERHEEAQMAVIDR